MKRTRPMWNACAECNQDFQAYEYQETCKSCKASKAPKKADKHLDHEILIDSNKILQDNGHMGNLMK